MTALQRWREAEEKNPTLTKRAPVGGAQGKWGTRKFKTVLPQAWATRPEPAGLSSGSWDRVSRIRSKERGSTRIGAAERRGKELSTTSTPSHGRLIDFARDLWREIQDDHVLDGAAVLAYFFLLAVFPAALIVLSLLPSLSIPHLQEAILDLLHQILPQQSANLFEGTVRYVASEGRGGLLTFGLIFTVWSASSGVSAIMEQLNVVHDVKERRPFWKARRTALLLLVFFVLLAVGSLSLVIFGGVVQSWLASIIGWSRPLVIFFATLRWIIIGVALLLTLAVIYRFGPDVNLKFRFISPGNVVAATLIALTSIGLRFYVSKFGNYSATYGNLAAMIILMLWMYMAGIALLVGCEINAILRRPKKE
jgi:membrane protein